MKKFMTFLCKRTPTFTVLAVLVGLTCAEPAYAQNPAVYNVNLSATYSNHVLRHPTGIAIANYKQVSSGTFEHYLIIADTNNHVIRSFELYPTAGSLTVLAGEVGSAGYVDSQNPLTAKFAQPTGLVADELCWTQQGRGGQSYCNTTIYVSDSSNCRIRAIGGSSTIGGTVRTVAGSSLCGFVNGPVLSSQFTKVLAPLIGFTYPDSENNALRQLTSTVTNGVRTFNTTTTYAGTGAPGLVNGPLSVAQFNAPSAIVQDYQANSYLTDTANHVIRKIDKSGNVTTFAGTGVAGYKDGSAATAQFDVPLGIAFDGTYFYVADAMNNVIRKIDTSGSVSTFAGNGTPGQIDGALSQAEFRGPSGLCLYGSFLFVSDTLNNAIRRIDLSNNVVSTYIN